MLTIMEPFSHFIFAFLHSSMIDFLGIFLSECVQHESQIWVSETCCQFSFVSPPEKKIERKSRLAIFLLWHCTSFKRRLRSDKTKEARRRWNSSTFRRTPALPALAGDLWAAVSATVNGCSVRFGLCVLVHLSIFHFGFRYTFAWMEAVQRTPNRPAR